MVQGSNEALAFLARLATEFTAVLSLSDLLEDVMQALREETRFDSCAVSLLDARNPEILTIRATSGLRDSFRGKEFWRGQGLLWVVMDTGAPLIVPDMHADPRTHRSDPILRSAIYAPLMVHGRPIGVLSAYRVTTGAFTEAELNLLTVVARYLAGAVEVARLHERMKKLAATDALTGLGNRRCFLDRLEAEMERSRRAGYELSIALLDLNRFKLVNDVYGHTAGDAVLIRVGEILAQAIRGSDLAARFGGDEFVLLFPETPPAKADEVLSRLRHLEILIPDGGGSRAHVSFSWGIASWPMDAEDWERLLQVADSRLYAMKQGADTATSRPVTPGAPTDA
ncbi:MAG TPA: sensor domain-containing diguanylate cyclase [bacterium]|nr:sensor domain-containing diguanylate cyclase [bacterium]